jgi:hypothetical protein
MIIKIFEKKDQLMLKLRKHVRKKAIKQFERKIQLLQKEVSDYSKDELEGLVAIEEKEIIKNYKNFSIMALLSLLGLNYFNH